MFDSFCITLDCSEQNLHKHGSARQYNLRQPNLLSKFQFRKAEHIKHFTTRKTVYIVRFQFGNFTSYMSNYTKTIGLVPINLGDVVYDYKLAQLLWLRFEMTLLNVLNIILHFHLITIMLELKMVSVSVLVDVVFDCLLISKHTNHEFRIFETI